MRLGRPICARSSRLVLLCALLAVAGLLPGVASAAPEDGALVVQGRGGTTAEWVLAGSLPTNVFRDGVEVTGGGDYAGALLEPLDPRQPPLGVLQVRAFADETRDVAAWTGSGQLQPGRYRVTLFGDGPVRVRFRLQDPEAPGIQIVPRTRIPVTFLGRSQAIDSGYGAARIELPRAVPAGRRALQVTLSTGTEVGRAQSCATTGTECERPLLPVCLPAPAPCPGPTTSGPQPSASSGDPRGGFSLVPPAKAPRTLLWSFDGYRDSPGKLRAAAIIF